MIKFLSKKTLFIVFLVIVCLGVLLLVGSVKAPKVISTSPENGEQEVLETKQISINFDANVPQGVKTGISVSFDPQTDFDSTWLANTYKIVPKKSLTNNTEYDIKVSYKNKEIYNFQFNTAIFSQEDIKKYGSLQSQDDYLFGQALKSLVEKYPFYTSLPIKTQNYVVYYDFEQEKFAITFLIPTESQEQKDILIKDALDKIKKIGGKDPIQYYTQP